MPQAGPMHVALLAGLTAVNSLKQELRSGITDVAFLLLDAIHEADLKSEVLGFVKLLFICSPDSKLSTGKMVRLKDMEQQTLLLPKYDCRYQSTFVRDLAELKVAPAAILELNSIETIKACVEQGVGISFLPEMAVEEALRQGRLASFEIDDKQMETAILMILHKNKWLSPSMEAFIREVKACFA